MKKVETTILMTEESNLNLMKVVKVISSENGPFRNMDRKDVISYAITRAKTKMLQAIDKSSGSALQFSEIPSPEGGKPQNSVRYSTVLLASVSKNVPSDIVTIYEDDLERLNVMVDTLQFNGSSLITKRNVRFELTTRQQVMESILLGALCAVLLAYYYDESGRYKMSFNGVKVDPFTIETMFFPIVTGSDYANLVLNWKDKNPEVYGAFTFIGRMEKVKSARIIYNSGKKFKPVPSVKDGYMPLSVWNCM